MSFDIHFQPCRYIQQPVMRTNPFTGEESLSVLSDPLGDSELASVQAVLSRVSANLPDEFGCSIIEFSDGGSAEIFCDKPERGCMASIRRMTPAVIEFLFDLLAAGKWVMIPIMEDCLAITTSPESLKGVPEDYPTIVAIQSVQELVVLLTRGFRAWDKYRDQIVLPRRSQ